MKDKKSILSKPVTIILLALLTVFIKNIDAQQAGTMPGLNKAEAVNDLTLSINSQELAKWGYLNVRSFGAKGDGVTDDTEAIQNAINAGYEQEMGVLFPLGTYIISNTLYCDKVWPNKPFPRKCHILVGEELNGQRPLIKLATGSLVAFDNQLKPKSMIQYNNFLTPAEEVKSTAEFRALDPFTLPNADKPKPGVIFNSTANIFDEVLWGIDFDCSGHPGAMGLFYASAQKSILVNVKVTAIDAHTGIYGVPGRNSGAVNIEVEGGKTGLFIPSSTAGTTITGLKLHGQTGQAIKATDFCPTCIVGFHIKMDKTPFLITTESWAQTAVGTIAFIDGVFETSEKNGTIVDNKLGKSIYARNVYVKGGSAFIKSGTQPEIKGKGNYYRIKEYAYTDQTETIDLRFNTWSIINGKKKQQNPAEPIVKIENNTPVPSDFVKMHTFDKLPYLTFRDKSQTICITDYPYNAKPGGTDCTIAIQKAVDDASATNKIVLIPKGVFTVSKTIHLHANTQMVGVGCKRHASWPISAIAASEAWVDSPENEAILQTVNDSEAETYLYGFNLISANNVKHHIHWRAGRKSTMMNLSFDGGVAVENTIYFSDNGGGRHYSLEPQTSRYKSTHRHIFTNNTTQPLSWYGCNLEVQKNGYVNAEFLNSKNIRIYGIKREGASPTFVINNCENIAIYAQGAMREGLPAERIGYVQIKGNSKNILIPLVLVQRKGTMGASTLIESLDGKPVVSVTYPECISVYKRGEIDDSKMYYFKK